MSLVDYREGGRLRISDLRDRTDALESEREDHLTRSHDTTAIDPENLHGTVVMTPTRSTSVSYTSGALGRDVAFRVGEVNALRLRSNARHELNADFIVDGSATISGPLRLSPEVPPKEARPWSVSALQPTEDVPHADLRIELGADPMVDPAKQQLAIGQTRISAAGDVAVAGNLIINGQLSSGDIEADPSDPRFAKAIRNVIADAVVQAASQGSLGVFAKRNVSKKPETIDITITSFTFGIQRWAIALTTTRRGSTKRLAGVFDGPLNWGATQASIPANWSPPLEPGEIFDVAVAVAGIDSNRQSVGGASSFNVKVP